MSDSVVLRIEAPGTDPRVFTIVADGEITIGRDSTCSVVLPSPDVSRRHIALQVEAMSVVVQDTSSNGTLVGEFNVHNAAVRVVFGTPIYVGPYVVWVEGVHAGYGDAQQAHDANAAPGMHPTANGSPMDGLGVNSNGMIPGRQGSATSGGVTSLEAQHSHGAVSPGQASIATRKKIHRLLLDHLDLQSIDRAKMDDQIMRPRVREALKRIILQLGNEIGPQVNTGTLINELTDEALGLGPLEHFLADPTVSEIMVIDPQTIYIERRGKLERSPARFTDDDAVRSVIERIVTPLGRRIDESTPLVDARLRDGSRVNAIIRPLALRGACITIRKFAKVPLKLHDLVSKNSLTEQMGRFLTRSVIAKRNVVISGGTGSGKTTLLNVLSGAIPPDERIVTIEDAAELQLPQPHVVSLESRPPNMEGRGEYTIRDLLKNALRMRPDRIVVGECRGGEALDMLQAMNTGHDGSLTTTHANSPREAIARLETLALMSGLDLPSRAIREQIAASVHLVVQQSRFGDGTRRITSIAEVTGLGDEGDVEMQEIFVFKRSGTSKDGTILGEYRATGYLPSFLDKLIAQGLVQGGEYL